jgi:predicted RNA binding protein YcfA (HicA-like mRNA interferase family)
MFGMAEWEKKVKKALLEHGYVFKRSAKGSHEMWYNKDTNVTIIISHKIGRDLANVIMKQANIDKKY